MYLLNHLRKRIEIKMKSLTLRTEVAVNKSNFCWPQSSVSSYDFEIE